MYARRPLQVGRRSRPGAVAAELLQAARRRSSIEARPAARGPQGRRHGSVGASGRLLHHGECRTTTGQNEPLKKLRHLLRATGVAAVAGSAFFREGPRRRSAALSALQSRMPSSMKPANGCGSCKLSVRQKPPGCLRSALLLPAISSGSAPAGGALRCSRQYSQERASAPRPMLPRDEMQRNPSRRRALSRCRNCRQRQPNTRPRSVNSVPRAPGSNVS